MAHWDLIIYTWTRNPFRTTSKKSRIQWPFYLHNAELPKLLRNNSTPQIHFELKIFPKTFKSLLNDIDFFVDENWHWKLHGPQFAQILYMDGKSTFVTHWEITNLSIWGSIQACALKIRIFSVLFTLFELNIFLKHSTTTFNTINMFSDKFWS